MKGCLSGIIQLWMASFFILLVYYFITDEKEAVTIPMTTYEYPLVDPNREVHHFDWETMKYVYKDEIQISQPSQVIYLKEVGIKEKSPWAEKQVVIEGKRYRINEKPNGDLQFIRIR